MKLNNKGITLIEIIMSIALITIVLVFISLLLIDVKDINDNSKVNATYLIDKALAIKVIEEDLMKYKSITIGKTCDITNIYADYVKNDLEQKNQFSECFEITINDATEENKVAYLGVYYFKSHESYVISYIHGQIERKTTDFKQFDKYNLNSSGELINEKLKMSITLNNSTYYYDGTHEGSEVVFPYTGAAVITIPLIGSDGKDYTIKIPYYGEIKIEE